MNELIDQLLRAQDVARGARKKGDALRRAGWSDHEVQDAYQAGVQAIEVSTREASPAYERLCTAGQPATGEDARLVDQLVESWGVLGGLYQRLHQADRAIEAYARGARLEEKFALPGTYNRLNEIKQTLLLGAGMTLAKLRPSIESLAQHIDKTLSSDQTLSDSGWAWADLGDCLTLLGRPAADSEHAYASFIAKAEIKSPERTLDVLREIAQALEARGDPGAPALKGAIDTLQSRLAKR